MKHLILTILVLAVCMGLFAAGGITLTPQRLLPGQEVSVAVNATLPEAPLSAEFSFRYDPAVLEFTGLELGTLTGNALHAVHDREGVLRAAFASSEPFPALSGSLCVLTFKVKQGPGHTTFSLKDMRVDDHLKPGQSLSLDLTKPLKHNDQ